MITRSRMGLTVIAVVLAACAAQAPVLKTATEQPRPDDPLQTEANAYTRYELLAPGTAQFRIVYDVTATTAGAESYFNPIRHGSVATDESVLDRASGKPLQFEIVGAAAARAQGIPEAKDGDQFIQVHLARKVPAEGQARLRIIKTYRDEKSYFERDGLLVFTRPLGIRRNALLLPAGYEVSSCNYPSQVITEPSGRLLISFIGVGEGAVPLTVEARRTGAHLLPSQVEERAVQDREIVYSLQPPETHSFDLFHDYTEAKPGADKYLNVVRTGSTASNPAARVLDTGATLPVEKLLGDAIPTGWLEPGEAITRETEVVVVSFPAVREGESVRLRISETYTDPRSYRLEGGQLIFDRSFGRPANAVLLPPGWALTGSSIPATVSASGDRVRLNFVNPRNDEIHVVITAVKR